MKANEVGIAGEVRCIVTREDGSIKADTGFQKNLILNQGLDFFGGGNGNSINAYCAIGSGNSPPAITQTKLDAYIAQVSGTDTTSDYSYVDKGDGLYRMWEQKKYRFTGLDNVNISEVGLISTGTLSTNYYLTTRVLIKDSFGAPTSISVKTGETLDIYYKVHKVIDTSDKSFVINVLDGEGGSVPYNVVIRPSMLGHPKTLSITTKLEIVSNSYGGLSSDNNDLASNVDSSDWGRNGGAVSLGSYSTGSYKNIATLVFGLNNANVVNGVRRLGFYPDSTRGVAISFLTFQMRLGRVSDDAPLIKTNKDTLTVPIEFSWGRYEGTL